MIWEPVLELDEDDLTRLEQVANDATPGPWDIQRDDHPHMFGGHHTEWRIKTSWIQGQLKDHFPVVTMSVGVPAKEGGRAIPMVRMSADDANFIASFNPVVAKQLLRLARIGWQAEQDALPKGAPHGGPHPA